MKPIFVLNGLLRMDGLTWNSLPNSWQTSNTIKEPAQGSIIKSPGLVVAVINAFINSLGFWWGCFRLLLGTTFSSQTFPKERFLNNLPLCGNFWIRKQNSALLLNQEPNPSVFFLCQTKQSTIFKERVFNNHKGMRSLPSKVLFTHNKQKALGFNTRSICSNILKIW